MNVLLTLVRREFWEHRALWIAPLIVATLLVISVLFFRVDMDASADVRVGGDVATLQLDPEQRPAERGGFAPLDREKRVAIFAMGLWGMLMPFALVTMVLLFFYLLDCLYTERKDRSILFWKSLPVSDSATVASKLLVGLVIVPLGVFSLAAVTGIVSSGILAARAGLGQLAAPIAEWDTAIWFQLQLIVLFGLVIAMLWYAPIAGYLLLVSAWARRNVFLWAVLPPVIALAVEEITLDTHYVGTLLSHRLFGGGDELNYWQALDLSEGSTRGMAATVGSFFERFDMAALATSVSLWAGVAVAAAFVFGAIRIRQYRDDT